MDVLEDLKGRARRAAEQLSVLLSPGVPSSHTDQSESENRSSFAGSHPRTGRIENSGTGNQAAAATTAAGTGTAGVRRGRSRRKPSGRRSSRDGRLRNGSAGSSPARIREKQKTRAGDSWQREVAELGSFATLLPGNSRQEPTGATRDLQPTASSAPHLTPQSQPRASSPSPSPNPRLFPPRSISFPPLLPPTPPPVLPPLLLSPGVPPSPASPPAASPPEAQHRFSPDAPLRSFPGGELVHGQPSRHSLLHRLASRVSRPEDNPWGRDGEDDEAIPRWDGGWERRHGRSAGWTAEAAGKSAERPAVAGGGGLWGAWGRNQRGEKYADAGREELGGRERGRGGGGGSRGGGKDGSLPLVEMEPANERIEILVLRGAEGGATARQGDVRRKKGAAGVVAGAAAGAVVQRGGSTGVQSMMPSSVDRPESVDNLGLLRRCIRQVSGLLSSQNCKEDGESSPSREVIVTSSPGYNSYIVADREIRRREEEARAHHTPDIHGLLRRLPIRLGGWRAGASGEEVEEGMGEAERWNAMGIGRGMEAGMGMGSRLNSRLVRSSASFRRGGVTRGAGWAAGAPGLAGGRAGGGGGVGGGAGGAGAREGLSVSELRELVEANPEAFLRAFESVAKRVEALRKRRTITVTSKYHSRTNILRSAVSLDIPSLPFPLPSFSLFPSSSSSSSLTPPSASSSSPSSSSPSLSPRTSSSSRASPSFPLRIRAVAEGRPSSPFTRFSIAPEIGPLRLRWDRPRLVPSFGATLHSGDNSLVQVFHDIQERPSRRTALMVGWWARSLTYRAIAAVKLPACHVDMLWFDFPRGEFFLNRGTGLKASLFLPFRPLEGVLQVEGRSVETTTAGFAYQHPLGTRVTPSYSLADRGVSVEVQQPITMRQLGPAVKPEAQIRFKSTVTGTRQGWEVEATKFLCADEVIGGAAGAAQGGLAVSVGYKAGVAPVGFVTLSGGGRRRRKAAAGGKGAGYQLRLEVPPSNPRRAVISWDATHAFDF